MSYPILLDLSGRRVVVVGGGRVAARKVGDLLDAGAQITLISPMLHADLNAIAARIDVRLTSYKSGMLAALRPLLIFAATDSPDVNQRVAEEAHALGVLVNIADDSSPRDFTNMATIRRGEITIALATGGASPALTAHLRERLAESIAGSIGEEYVTLTRWLGDLRPAINAQVSPQKRSGLWRAILASPVLAHLRDGDEAGARAIIDTLITDAINERD